jgi:hypothetical protein
VVGEDVAGFLDVVADAGGGDLQELGQHVHRADLSLVQQREQEPSGIIEQRLVADFPASPPRPTAALLAVALLGAGSLGRGESGGKLCSCAVLMPMSRSSASLPSTAWRCWAGPPASPTGADPMESETSCGCRL